MSNYTEQHDPRISGADFENEQGDDLSETLLACDLVSLKRIREDIQYTLLKRCEERERQAVACQKLYNTDKTEELRAIQMAEVYKAFLALVSEYIPPAPQRTNTEA